MNKKFLAVLGAAALVALLGAGCGGGGPEGTSGGGGGLSGGNLITDMCNQISGEFVGQATGKTIVRTEPGPVQPGYCQYFFNYSQDFYKLPEGKTSPGGDNVSLDYENLSVENQKKAQEFFGRKIETNDKIKMENFLAIQEDGLINSIFLVIDPNHFVSVDRSSGKAFSEEEMVNFAVKVAELLKKGVPAAKPPEQAPSQIDRAKEFFNDLAGKKIDDALAMMDANQDTKQMWGVNFNTIKSLSVVSAEPAYQEEWTPTHQVFKFVLNVSVTSEGEGYGWSQGKNTRWLSLEKNGDVWEVHELANNP